MSINPITVFLDFDGVMHAAVPFAHETLFVRKDCVTRALLKHSEHLEIVLSTSWREHHSENDLKEIFVPELAHLIVGVTPNLRALNTTWLPGTSRYIRQAECEMWLRANRSFSQRRIFIDDVDFWFEPNCEDLLLTDGLQGFRDGDALTLAMMINERL